jgi:hypothetical protein
MNSASATLTVVTPPLPANFHQWPQSMRQRFLRHALSIVT